MKYILELTVLILFALTIGLSMMSDTPDTPDTPVDRYGSYHEW